jgi:cytochrome b subunit of formate dehydrogenase
MYANLLKKMCGPLAIISTKVCNLKGCVIGRLYLGCIWIMVTEYSSAITHKFDIIIVILFVISHIISAIYSNSNESSGGISGCNEGIFLSRANN